MQKRGTLEKIEREAEKLTLQEKLILLEKLIHKIRNTGMVGEKSFDWSKLYGVGKGIWKGEDAQEYINRLREERL